MFAEKLEDKDVVIKSRKSKKASIQFNAVVIIIVWWLDLQLHMQSVPISTNVVSSNPAHGDVYSIQHYVIKFISDLRQVDGFLRVF
jgi:hypothetical protein